MSKPTAKKSSAVHVTECKEGDTYVYPGIGPVLCKGVQVMPIPGFDDVKTIVLEERYTPMPRTMRIPEAKLKTSGLRLPADEATMDQAIGIIAKADGSGPNIKSVGKLHNYYNARVNSPDVEGLAGMIAKTLGSDILADHAYKGRTNVGTEFGNKALTILAREYAYVKKIGIHEATAFVTEKSGKLRLLKESPAEAASAPELLPETP